VFEIRDVPGPVPRDHEVLVRVHASTVCFGDRMIRQGPLLVRLMNGLRRPKTAILGADLAGTVVATGNSVTRFAPGDEVFGSRGEKFGAYAEFACISEDGFLARKPANMAMEEAATVFVGAVCSLYFLRAQSRESRGRHRRRQAIAAANPMQTSHDVTPVLILPREKY
jgi:NADPH:quinone reductase-like Zn-dependent oxidoreductase